MANDVLANFVTLGIEATVASRLDVTFITLDIEASAPGTHLWWNDELNYTEGKKINTNKPLKYPVYGLPFLEVEANFGERCELLEDLPVLESVGYSGSVADNDLPEFQAVGEVSTRTSSDLDLDLPELQLSSRVASRASELILPSFSVVGTIERATVSTLSKVIPSISLDAHGYCGDLNLTVSLPPLSVTATGIHSAVVAQPDIDGAGTITGLKIVASGRSGGIGSADIQLPELNITARSTSVVIYLEAYLPQVVSQLSSGEGDGNSRNVIRTDRFDGDLLRYSRWA